MSLNCLGCRNLAAAVAAKTAKLAALREASNAALRQIQAGGSPPPGGLEIALPYYARLIRERAEKAEAEVARLKGELKIAKAVVAAAKDWADYSRGHAGHCAARERLFSLVAAGRVEFVKGGRG